MDPTGQPDEGKDQSDDPVIALKPKPKRKTKPKAAPKTSNPRFDALAELCFGVKPGEPAGEQTGARVGKALKEIDQRWPDPDRPVTAEDIYYAFRYHDTTRTSERPRDAVKVVSLIAEALNARSVGLDPAPEVDEYTGERPYTADDIERITAEQEAERAAVRARNLEKINAQKANV